MDRAARRKNRIGGEPLGNPALPRCTAQGRTISTLDEARFDLLYLRCGAWNGKQVLSSAWVKESITPSAVNPDYGLFWWQITGRRQWPSAPESSFAAIGHGSIIIWIDPDHDLAVVRRWFDGSADEFLSRILASIRE